MTAAAESTQSPQEIFLRTIFGTNEGVVFIGTLDREHDRRWTDNGFAYPAEITQAVQHITQADLLDMDAYVAAQLYRTKNGGRRKGNVKICPVAWSDLDTAHPDKVQPVPSLVVETSPGRFHGYWRTETPMEPQVAEELSRRIAYAHHAHGADLGGWDLTQVLRVPGTHNHKYPERPEVTVWMFNPEPLTMDAFQTLPEAPQAASGPEQYSDPNEPPVELRGYDLEHWQAESVSDRSSWAMHMVAVLKEHGLADRMVEIALANHPIYLDKAREKWGNRESVIVDDIRRCLHLWKNQTGPIWEWGQHSTQHATQTVNAGDFANTHSTQPSTQWEYPLSSIGAYMDVIQEDDEPVVDSLIWRGRTHWAFSSPGAGKTLLLIGAGIHIAAGLPFCGRPVQQGGVLLLEEDSPQSVIADYARLLFDIYDVDPYAIPFWINRKRGLRITDITWVQRAIAAVESCPELPRIVILDTCERIAPSDSFTSKELEPLTIFLAWCTERGIAVVVIDHTRKIPPIVRKDDAPKQDPIDLLYGGRSKSGISDVMLYFSGNYQTGLHGEFCKFRGEAPPPIDVKFSSDHGFVLLDKPVKQLNESEHKVTRYLNNNSPEMWRPAREIVEATGLNPRSAERVLQGLVRKRWLLKRGSTSDSEYRVNTAIPGVFG